MSAVLKLVQAEQFSEELAVDGVASGAHSLQGAFHYCSPWRPQLARYVIERFSKKGAIVCDPFCSTGLVGIEALLAGRSFIGCTHDPSLAKLARARLNPADIAEVALRLQFVPFKRPVDIQVYSGPFPHFFDSDTFRELINLKSSLRSSSDGASAFVGFVAASILHGHTAGHLSAYTSPSEALSPDAQKALNRKRAQVPSARAVSGRILTKAAHLLRDGVPSILESASQTQREVHCADPAALNAVRTATVDLAMLVPDQPGYFEHGLHSWLRTWWLGVDMPEEVSGSKTISGWRDINNEVLVEMARIVRPGGRAIVRAGQGRCGTKPVHYKREIEDMVNSCLHKFWRIEGSISERYMDNSRGRDAQNAHGSELIVLRRK